MTPTQCSRLGARRGPWERLPTIVASGISSWNTKEVVEDEWGAVGPLHIGEMEEAMGYDVGYTQVEGLHMRDRYKVIDNAFHAGVMKHILKCCISDMAMSGVVTRDDVRRQEVPFTENKDHVEPGGLWAEFIQESLTVEAA